MEHRKTVSAILSAVTACTLLPAIPAVYAAETEVPDWVPADFKEACSFDNTCGSTLVKDDIICIVTRHTGEGTVKRLPLLGSGNYKTLADEWYKGEFESYGDLYPYYHVTVYQPEESKSIVFYDYDTESGKETPNEDQYIFTVDQELHVTEADWRAVVPDCITEYRDFIKETGNEYGLGTDGFTTCNIDGRSRFVIMAAASNGFAGSYMTGTITVNGTKCESRLSNCNLKYAGPEPTDQGSTFVRFLEITEPADIEATLEHHAGYNEHEPFSVTKKLKAEKDSSGFISVSAVQVTAVPDEWREFVPDNCTKAWEFIKSKGLASNDTDHLYNDFNLDCRGDYLIAATASYGGLSPAMTEIEVMLDGKPLAMEISDCSSGNADGECLVRYAKIAEPCTLTANIQNAYYDYRKTVTIRVTKDSEGKLSFAAEDGLYFMPKDYDEAYNFGTANWGVSLHDGYIVCSGRINRTTGYDVLIDKAGTAGAVIVDKASFSCESNELLDGADDTFRFYVLRPRSEGMLKTAVRLAREWNLNEGEVIGTKFYTVSDDLSFKELRISMGDLDNNGKTEAADLVLLSKYLGGVQNLDEVQFFAADLTNDNRLNAADFSVMKQQLIEERMTRPTPAAEA